MTKRAALATILAALLVVMSVGAVADDLTRVDDSHDLANDDSIDEWQSGGHVEGDIDTYDATITVAEDREDVADEPLITDFSDWVKIEYNEEIDRTLRIYLPKEYGQPYERSDVESITSDHTAELKPAEDGEYQSITIDVDEPSEIVIPLEWDGQASYWILESLDERWEQVQEHNPLNSEADWEHLDHDDLGEESAVTVAESDDVLIEVDARPDQPDPHWVPAPEGDSDAPVYWHQQETDDGVETVVVSTVDDPPDVRYAEDHGLVDRFWSEVNSAREIPSRLIGGIEVPDWVPVIGDD